PGAPPERKTAPADGGPVELPPGVWEPPPVRRTDGAAGAKKETPATQPAATSSATPAAARPVTPVAKRRRGAWFASGLLAVVPPLLGLYGWIGQIVSASSEEQRRQKAEQEYKDRNFGEAARLFDELEREFPQSEHRRLYEFLGRLSAERE